MFELPDQPSLPIHLFNEIFKDTTNSYKFYWLWSILDELNESQNLTLNCDKLALRMISLAWYPLYYYKLSFGKQDSFKKLSSLLNESIDIDHRSDLFTLLNHIEGRVEDEPITMVKSSITILLKRWVIYRFLRPFFSYELIGIKDQYVNSTIKALTINKTGHAPYHFDKNDIVLDTKWASYMQSNQYILRGFIKWHLLRFLQKNNSNVVGLTEKLERPISRNLVFAKEYWTSFLLATSTQCIYRADNLSLNDISYDHFIPWSYIAHDQIWNIVPTTKSTNSSKSDSLPNMALYSEKFCKLQFAAMSFHVANSTTRFLEDFYNLFKIDNLGQLSYEQFRQLLLEEIEQHYRVARNLGFTKIFY
jgi:hypothetical protein